MESLPNASVTGRGHFFENYVVAEFLRMYSCSQTKTNMTFYRDTNQKEIDNSCIPCNII